MVRKKLQKLLGKELEYTATYDKKKGGQVCLVDVEYGGKVFADHVWVHYADRMAKYKHGDKLRFFAVAYTYKDSFNVRKNGINRCHSYMIVDDQYDVAMKDTEERLKRTRR